MSMQALIWAALLGAAAYYSGLARRPPGKPRARTSGPERRRRFKGRSVPKGGAIIHRS